MPENIPIDVEPAPPPQEPFNVWFRRAFGWPLPTPAELSQAQACLYHVRGKSYLRSECLVATRDDQVFIREPTRAIRDEGDIVVWGVLPSMSGSIRNFMQLVDIPEVNLDRDWVPGTNPGICDICGEFHEENYIQEKFATRICEDCIQSIRKDHKVCEDCGAILTGSQKLYTTPEGEYCHECAKVGAEREGWTQCEHCDIYTDESTVTVNDSEEWCPDCVSSDATCCNDCGSYYSSLSIVHGRNGRSRSVCNACRDSRYFTCANCGDVFHESLSNDDGDGNNICDGCHSDLEEAEEDEDGAFGSARTSYHTTPKVWMRHTSGSAPAFFGLEIETEGGEEVEWTRYDSIPGLKNWIATEDGSLDETGIEFVSPALPLHDWESEGKAFQKMAESNERYAWKRESCGLHVHMSVTDEMSGDALQKAMLKPFWADFSRPPTEEAFSTGKEFMRWLGRRYSERYAHFPSNTYLSDRYLCVRRLTDHVEIRIFRSTTDAASIRGIVGVCDAWQKAARESYESQEQWFKSFVDHCTLDKHALQYLERCCKTTKNEWTERYRALVPTETKQPEEETATCA